MRLETLGCYNGLVMSVGGRGVTDGKARAEA